MTDQHSQHRKQKEYYNQTRSEMLPFIPSYTKTLLEIGCGNGQFSKAIKDKWDAEIWGVELDGSAAAEAKNHIDRVLLGPIEAHIECLPNVYFDCICMNDVIEHLLDPWQVLDSLRAKLRPGGVIIASIPNVRYYKNLSSLLFDGDWRYVDAGILDRTHLRFFTYNSMKTLFEETGYILERIEGIKRSRKFKLRLWQLLSGGKLWDIAYMQFAIVASPAKKQLQK